MKKNYEALLINVISLDNADVITASAGNFATAMSNMLGDNFNLGDLDVQPF